MTAPPRRFSGSRVAHGLAFAPGRAPADPAVWLRWLAPGDRVCDLPSGFRVVLFDRPRRVAEPPLHADLLMTVAQGLSSVAGPHSTPLRPGWIEVAELGRRHQHPIPGPDAPVPPLFSLPDVRVHPTVPIGRPVPPPASDAASFGLVSKRLGLVRDRPADAAPAPDAAPSAAPAARSRVGDWLARFGAAALRDMLAIFQPDAPRPPPREAVPDGPPIGARPLRFPRLFGLVQGALMGLGAVAAAVAVAVKGLARVLAAPLRREAAPSPSRTRRPRGPSVWSRLWKRLSDRWSVVRMSFGLQRHHARLLRELVSWFETDDLLEALRHAIPLGGAGDAPPTGWFMGRLGRREALEPAGASSTSGGAISGGEEVLGLLRRLYEDAHQQLDRDGDVERAAWVLAELLREPDRALAYLQDKNRPRVAAEWADLLGLPIERRVWLWVQAGDLDRAARLARLDGTVVEALLVLGSGPVDRHKRELRRHIACGAFAEGQVELAVRLLARTPDAEDRALLHTRVHRALAEPEHRPWSLPAALSLFPTPELRARLEQALDRGPDARVALGMALLGWPRVPEADVERIFRALLHDTTELRTASAAAARTLSLVRRHALPVDLIADLPPLPELESPAFGVGGVLTLPPVRASGPTVRAVDLSPHHLLVAVLGPHATLRSCPVVPRAPLPRGFDGLVGGPGRRLAFVADRSGATHLWWLDAEGPPVPGPAIPPEVRVHNAVRGASGLLWTCSPHGVQAWRVRERHLDRVWASALEPGARPLALDVSDKHVWALVRVGTHLELRIWERAPGMVLRWRRPVRLPTEIARDASFFLAGETVFCGTPGGVYAPEEGVWSRAARPLGTVGTRIALAFGSGVWLREGGREGGLHITAGGVTPTAVRGLPRDQVLIAWQGGTVDLIDIGRAQHRQRWDLVALAP